MLQIRFPRKVQRRIKKADKKEVEEVHCFLTRSMSAMTQSRPIRNHWQEVATEPEVEIVWRLSLCFLRGKHRFYRRRDHLSTICAQVLPTSLSRARRRRRLRKRKPRGKKAWPAQEGAEERDSLSDWASEWICKEESSRRKREREGERGRERGLDVRRKRTELFVRPRSEGLRVAFSPQSGYLYFSYFLFSLHVLFVTPFTPRFIRLLLSPTATLIFLLVACLPSPTPSPVSSYLRLT